MQNEILEKPANKR